MSQHSMLTRDLSQSDSLIDGIFMMLGALGQCLLLGSTASLSLFRRFKFQAGALQRSPMPWLVLEHAPKV